AEAGGALAGEIREGRLRIPGNTAPLSVLTGHLRPHPALRVERAAVAAQPVLENAHFRLAVDPLAGGVVSLVEQGSGHEWVGASEAGRFAGYRYDLFSAADIAAFLRA